MKLVFVASLLSPAGNIKEKEQKLFGSASGYCIRVEQHVYPRTVVAMSKNYQNPIKRVGLVHIIII
jgi:hypothetical protein